MMSALFSIALLAFASAILINVNFAEAFVPTKATFATQPPLLPGLGRRTFNKPIEMLPSSSFLLVDEDIVAAVDAFEKTTANEAAASAFPALGLLRNFFIAIGAIVVALTAFTFLTVNFIVPKAAEQLESDTKRLRPGLWEEYEAKLEDGQTMSMRPDLLQDLGEIMRPIIIADFEKEQGGGGDTAPEGGAVEAKKEGESPTSRPSSTSQWED